MLNFYDLQFISKERFNVKWDVKQFGNPRRVCNKSHATVKKAQERLFSTGFLSRWRSRRIFTASANTADKQSGGKWNHQTWSVSFSG